MERPRWFVWHVLPITRENFQRNVSERSIS